MNDRVILDRLRFASTNQVSESVLRDVDVSIVRDVLTGSALVRLEAMVLAEKLVGDTCVATIQFPSSWFQHLKHDRWYLNLHKDRIMRWAAGRWPVKYTTHRVEVVFERYASFPRSTLDIPALGAPVIIERFGEAHWFEER